MGIEAQPSASNEQFRNFSVTAASQRDTPTAEALAQLHEFLSKHEVKLLGTKEVSFVIPAGTSRLDFITRAQAASCAVDPFCRVAQQDQIEKWQRDPMFSRSATKDTRVSIDCLVEDSGDKTRAEQADFLKERGLTMASLADLACAHAAIRLATEGRDAFRDGLRSHTVRGEGGQLISTPGGLTERAFFVHDSQGHPALKTASYL